MKLLIDMNLSPDWAGFLGTAGIEAEHWAFVGAPDALDTAITLFSSGPKRALTRSPPQLKAEPDREEIMKNLFRALAASGLFCLTAPAWAGDVNVVDNAKGKIPTVIQKDPFTRAAVPITNGGPNQGYSGATMFVTPGTGVSVHTGHMEPGGKIAPHEGGTVYILYVVRGTGKLINVDPAGAAVSEIAYKPDDLIVFQPNTHHKWENGPEPFDFIGINQPHPK